MSGQAPTQVAARYVGIALNTVGSSKRTKSKTRRLKALTASGG